MGFSIKEADRSHCISFPLGLGEREIVEVIALYPIFGWNNEEKKMLPVPIERVDRYAKSEKVGADRVLRYDSLGLYFLGRFVKTEGKRTTQDQDVLGHLSS